MLHIISKNLLKKISHSSQDHCFIIYLNSLKIYYLKFTNNSKTKLNNGKILYGGYLLIYFLNIHPLSIIKQLKKY
jgi:hypothetical protein